MTTNRYEQAAQAYKDALNSYTGKTGWNLAKEQAKDYAKTTGELARSGAYNAARTNGYGRAAAYSLANDANNRATTENLNVGMQNALNNNSNTTGAYAQNYSNQSDTASNVWKQRTGFAAGVTGTVGSILSAISDENLKKVYIDMDEFRKNTNKNKY